MIELKVKTSGGGDAGTFSVDESKLGGMVKKRLMHAAVVMYHANRRQGSACTKNRGEIAGSTKKLYRQKGTGRARAGNRKSGVRVGGGRIFGPKPRDYGFQMPKKQRRAALKSALLAKLKDGGVVTVDSFGITEIKTKRVTGLLSSLGIAGDKVLIATGEHGREVYLSGRNVDRVTVKSALDLNALDVLNTKHLVIEVASLTALIESANGAKSEVDEAPATDAPKAEAPKAEAPKADAADSDEG